MCVCVGGGQSTSLRREEGEEDGFEAAAGGTCGPVNEVSHCVMALRKGTVASHCLSKGLSPTPTHYRPLRLGQRWCANGAFLTQKKNGRKGGIAAFPAGKRTCMRI